MTSTVVRIGIALVTAAVACTGMSASAAAVSTASVHVAVPAKKKPPKKPKVSALRVTHSGQTSGVFTFPVPQQVDSVWHITATDEDDLNVLVRYSDGSIVGLLDSQISDLDGSFLIPAAPWRKVVALEVAEDDADGVVTWSVTIRPVTDLPVGRMSGSGSSTTVVRLPQALKVDMLGHFTYQGLHHFTVVAYSAKLGQVTILDPYNRDWAIDIDGVVVPAGTEYLVFDSQLNVSYGEGADTVWTYALH